MTEDRGKTSTTQIDPKICEFCCLIDMGTKESSCPHPFRGDGTGIFCKDAKSSFDKGKESK